MLLYHLKETSDPSALQPAVADAQQAAAILGARLEMLEPFDAEAERGWSGCVMLHAEEDLLERVQNDPSVAGLLEAITRSSQITKRWTFARR